MDESPQLMDRIDSLESRFVFQEQTIHALSMELFATNKRLETLEKHNRDLTQRIKELSDGGSPNTFPADQRPPHY